MKVSFWQNCYGILFFWPFMTILSSACLVSGIVFTSIDKGNFWPLLLFGIFLTICCIFIILFHKEVLTKIVFSDKSIELKRFGKVIRCIDWSDIKQVKQTYHGRYAVYMSFISHKEQIDVIPTKKMYDVINVLCPNIIAMINNIEDFKWLHKNKKEK